MTRIFLLFSLIFTLALVAVAQPDPNAPPPPEKPAKAGLKGDLKAIVQDVIKLSGQPALVATNAQGIFVLRNGVLAKYDPATMQQQKVVELFGAMPAGDAAADKQKMLIEYMKRVVPAAMLAPAKGDLIISIGDEFFRINPDTLEKVVDVNLAGDQQLPQLLTRFPELSQSPALQVMDKSVLLSRGNKLTRVSLADGKVLADIALPDQMNLNPFPQAGKAGAPAAAGDLTVTGTVSYHQEYNDYGWAVKDDKNQEYLLYGEQAKALAGVANILGQRVTVSGALYLKPGLPDTIKGIILVKNYKQLEVK